MPICAVCTALVIPVLLAISRRSLSATEPLSSATSLMCTMDPAATSRVRRTPWASPMGSAPFGQAARNRHQLSVHHVAAFALKRFTGLEGALGHRHDVAPPFARHAGGFATQRRVENGNRQLKADQME